MPRHRRHQRDTEANIWLGYTDLLSNSLFLLLLTVSVTIVARAFNDKPPLLQLTEKESFRFKTGSYALDQPFKTALDRRLKEIRTFIKDYRIDVVEVIGHTDGQPNPGSSNLDNKLIRSGRSQIKMGGYMVGSNSDLGLLRAMAVAQELRKKLDPDGSQNIIFRPYSAASLINTDGRWQPASASKEAARRRIELRLTRKEDTRPRQN
jgi:outer membrane protein OmpA-like peptidoglycan-associated protein